MSRHKEINSPISRDEELSCLQDQFAAHIGVNPEQLRGLRFCTHCGGIDHQWTDWSHTRIDGSLFESEEEFYDYRAYLADSVCQHCESTGFEGGNRQLTIDQWLALSLSSKK